MKKKIIWLFQQMQEKHFIYSLFTHDLKTKNFGKLEIEGTSISSVKGLPSV